MKLLILVRVGGALLSTVHSAIAKVIFYTIVRQNSIVTFIGNNFTITTWVFNGKGEVSLISHASSATPERLGATATSCVQR